MIPYLYEAQHISIDTPLIIRSLKLQWQPLVFHTWKFVGRVVGECCQAHTVLLVVVGMVGLTTTNNTALTTLRR